ncbi:hypothetical protein [Nostoc sp. UHCC 0870]|uniref:hypothetical protein n=1 Tax=Nostoc sp. UHCC 0870 TaxID=2914041 RepID=UPI001EDECCA7|nr:hypothetical protein [Nostoc sp. UHCC 0870]UKO98142.1 hypothetical protein L6494_26965 [Nostoc sp. UHCC 0870]
MCAKKLYANLRSPPHWAQFNGVPAHSRRSDTLGGYAIASSSQKMPQDKWFLLQSSTIVCQVLLTVCNNIVKLVYIK